MTYSDTGSWSANEFHLMDQTLNPFSKWLVNHITFGETIAPVGQLLL